MLDVAAVKAAFPELTDLAPIQSPSGQKEVLFGKANGAEIVLKLIKKNPQDAERTFREIEAATKLACTYVPRVLAQGQRRIGPEDRVFIVEQRIEGQTYRAILDASPTRPVAEVLDLIEALLLACCDFEASKLVHRDIKPENLIVDGAGKVWVIDFGLVRFLDEVSLTPTGAKLGLFTPGYGAPEQVRNLKSQISSRADLFSIGVVAYEALNGGNPYHAGKHDILQIITHVLNADLPRLNIPGDTGGVLSGFIGALTARYPSRRPTSAAEALQWFRPLKAKLGTSP